MPGGYRIYDAHSNFTKAQKSMPITEEMVKEVLNTFGKLVAAQFYRDYQSRFKFWDSASMIEQQWSYFEEHDYVPPVCDWVKWVFEKLGYKEK